MSGVSSEVGRNLRLPFYSEIVSHLFDTQKGWQQ